MKRRAVIAIGAALVAAGAIPAAAAERAAGSTPAANLRACPDGAFALPGSAGCLRLSGVVEADTTLRSGGRVPPATGGRGLTLHGDMRGHVAADVRIPTEYGPLRAYTSVRVGGSPAPDVLRR